MCSEQIHYDLFGGNCISITIVLGAICNFYLQVEGVRAKIMTRVFTGQMYYVKLRKNRLRPSYRNSFSLSVLMIRIKARLTQGYDHIYPSISIVQYII